VKSWNAHAWYITGILAALFVGSLSVQWNAVKDLPGIISFALGLSSLLLAVFAIIQSITAGGSAESSLSAVREASNGVAAMLSDIEIATRDLRTVSDTMLQSSEANRQEVLSLRNEIIPKSTTVEQLPGDRHTELPSALGDAAQAVASSNLLDSNRLTFGSSGALYVAIRSFQIGKSFKLEDIFPDDVNTFYERGVLAGLHLASSIDIDGYEGRLIVTKYKGDPDADLRELADITFTGVDAENYRARLKAIDRYFDINPSFASRDVQALTGRQL
jgi:hypothetical protein